MLEEVVDFNIIFLELVEIGLVDELVKIIKYSVCRELVRLYF